LTSNPDGKGESGSRQALVQIEQLAEAINDPVLYERAVSYGRDLEDFPILAIRVARQYFLKKKFNEALKLLPLSTLSPVHIRDDVDEIQMGCLKKLGRTEEWREALRTRVFRTADWRHFREFLAAIPPRDRKVAEGEILKAIHSGDYAPMAKALFFLDAGDVRTCSRIVLANPLSFEGRFYPELGRMARRLEASHPLAATALYRRLVEAVLSKSVAKYYRRAVNYLRSLDLLALRVNRWKPLARHADYVAELRAIHRRKTSLWELWNIGRHGGRI